MAEINREKLGDKLSCPFNDPLLRALLDRGNHHKLSRGQSFSLSAAPPASGVCFLQIQQGHFSVLNPEGCVVSDVEEGSFFGIAEFFMGLALNGFELQAAGAGDEFSLIQVPMELVEGITDSPQVLRASLYRACGMILMQETRELWRRSYPGSWLSPRPDHKPAQEPQPTPG